MHKKTVIFLFLGFFSLIGFTKNEPSYGGTDLSGYHRMNRLNGKKLLENRNISGFKHFPVTQLQKYDDAELTPGLPKFITHKLTEEDLYRKIVGKTLYGVTGGTGKPYALYLDEDQKAYVLMDDGRSERGEWNVDPSGIIHATWPTIHSGKATNCEYYGTQDPLYFVIGAPLKKGYEIMYARAGDTENIKNKN